MSLGATSDAAHHPALTLSPRPLAFVPLMRGPSSFPLNTLSSTLPTALPYLFLYLGTFFLDLHVTKAPSRVHVSAQIFYLSLNTPAKPTTSR